MKSFNKINCKDIKLGMRFSAPVFFDDGENMFLAEDKTVKQYHLVAISRWNMESVLTYGRILADDEVLEKEDDVGEIEEIEEVEEIEDLEDIDDLEEVEEPEEIEPVEEL